MMTKNRGSRAGLFGAAVALGLALLPAGQAPAQAQALSSASLPPLAANERVRRELVSAAIADEIRIQCPTITARILRALGRLHELETYAFSLGYSEDDVREMRRSEENRAELRRLRDAYLGENGVVQGDADSYCRLGMAEIERQTLVGWLLRAS
jgi:hypothetical protein